MSVMGQRDLLLELSHNCNLSCRMCGFGSHRNRPEQFMTLEVLERVLESVEPAPRSVRLNGRGESTIHPQFVEFLERIRAAWPDADLHLNTNLNTTQSELVEMLADRELLIYVSVDSSDRAELEHIRRGLSVERLESNLGRLRRMKRRPLMLFTLQEANMHRIRDIAEHAARWNCGLIYNVVRYDDDDGHLLSRVLLRYAEVRRDFIEAQRTMQAAGLPCFLPNRIKGVSLDIEGTNTTHGSIDECPAIDTELCILFNGDVTPCNMFNPFVYGNLIEQDYAEVLDGVAARTFREGRPDNAYCHDCACMGA